MTSVPCRAPMLLSCAALSMAGAGKQLHGCMGDPGCYIHALQPWRGSSMHTLRKGPLEPRSPRTTARRVPPWQSTGGVWSIRVRKRESRKTSSAGSAGAQRYGSAEQHGRGRWCPLVDQQHEGMRALRTSPQCRAAITHASAAPARRWRSGDARMCSQGSVGFMAK